MGRGTGQRRTSGEREQIPAAADTRARRQASAPLTSGRPVPLQSGPLLRPWPLMPPLQPGRRGARAGEINTEDGLRAARQRWAGRSIRGRQEGKGRPAVLAPAGLQPTWHPAPAVGQRVPEGPAVGTATLTIERPQPFHDILYPLRARPNMAGEATARGRHMRIRAQLRCLMHMAPRSSREVNFVSDF